MKKDIKKNYFGKIEDKSNKIIAFHVEDLDGEFFCKEIINLGGIEVSEELHNYMVSQGQVKFIGTLEKRVYTLEDKHLFETVVQPPINNQLTPSNEDRLSALETALMGVL